MTLKNNHEAIKKVIDLGARNKNKKIKRTFKTYKENTSSDVNLGMSSKEDGGEQTKQNKYLRLKRMFEAEK
jgi:hypothetical protein